MAIFSRTYQPNWDSLDKRPIPEWFNRAKFGIFVHWGVYSVPAWRPLSEKKYASYAEWYYARVMGDLEKGGQAFHEKHYGKNFQYRDFAPFFKAELFDAHAWAELFKKSGARYVVLTSKHHDGYCLWPTKSPYKKDWNSMAVGPKRDLVGELTKAVRAKGLKMGLYYSLIEWETNPTSRKPSGYWLSKETIAKHQIPLDKYVDKHVLPQLKELVTLYQPSLLFSDGGEWDEDADYWKTREFLAWLYNHAANKDEVVVNDRWAKGMPGKHGDYYSSEYEDTDAVGVHHAWEESRGVGGSYGFNRAENLEDYSTSTQLVHELIDIASRGGNLLLNVGPTADGRIPVIMQQRLMDIGEWLQVNGEAIYGTRAWKINKISKKDPGMNFYFTSKGTNLYLLCSNWPPAELEIPGILAKEIAKISMLGVKEKVAWQKSNQGIKIQAPLITPGQVPCRHAHVYKIEMNRDL